MLNLYHLLFIFLYIIHLSIIEIFTNFDEVIFGFSIPLRLIYYARTFIPSQNSPSSIDMVQNGIALN
jgi:hypothetical protein